MHNQDSVNLPSLAGIHHVKLPVSNLDRSLEWYRSRLGYESVMEFVEGGRRMGLYLQHANGGPDLALRLSPEQARRSAGFEYFIIGVPDKASIEALARRLTVMGEEHRGVIRATAGWMLPLLHDPDGHEVRFYSDDQPRPSLS